MEGESSQALSCTMAFFFLASSTTCRAKMHGHTTRARLSNTEEPAGLTDPPFSLFGIFKEDRTIPPSPLTYPLGATRIHVEM